MAGSRTPKGPAGGWFPRALLALLVLAALFPLAQMWEDHSAARTITYQGRSLAEWFYGSRTNFYQASTRAAAQEAINSNGSAAFAFLLSVLQEGRGDGPVYVSLYRSLPAAAQTSLPYPIPTDDLRMAALRHIQQMPQLSGKEVQQLADCAVQFENPRFRMQCFLVLLRRYQADPAFLSLCRRLLDDPHEGLRLKAAIYLAQSGIRENPADPRLFPLLVRGFESKELRQASLDLTSYTYQAAPATGSGRQKPPRPMWVQEPDEALLREIEIALARLERHLTPEEKSRLSQAEAHRKKPGFRPPGA